MVFVVSVRRDDMCRDTATVSLKDRKKIFLWEEMSSKEEEKEVSCAYMYASSTSSDPYQIYDVIGEDKDIDNNIAVSKAPVTMTWSSRDFTFRKVEKESQKGLEPYEWQRRYISAMDMPIDTPSMALERARVIQKIQSEFTETAASVVKLIVHESCFPENMRTIHTANVGGIAGGDKYISKGIIFKYAIDSKGIYGSDALAAKAAGSEMRSLRCVQSMSIVESERIYRDMNDVVEPNSEPDVVNTPLSTVVDYMGQRLVAVRYICFSLSLSSNQHTPTHTHSQLWFQSTAKRWCTDLLMLEITCTLMRVLIKEFDHSQNILILHHTPFLTRVKTESYLCTLR